MNMNFPGRRFFLHNDIFVHLLSFRCPIVFFPEGDSYYTAMFSSMCFFFVFYLSFDVGLISVLICVVILFWLWFMFIMVSISMLILTFVIMLKLILFYLFLLVFSFWFWFRCWRFCLTLFMLILTLIVDAGFEIGCWLLMLLFILILFWI